MPGRNLAKQELEATWKICVIDSLHKVGHKKTAKVLLAEAPSERYNGFCTATSRTIQKKKVRLDTRRNAKGKKISDHRWLDLQSNGGKALPHLRSFRTD